VVFLLVCVALAGCGGGSKPQGVVAAHPATPSATASVEPEATADPAVAARAAVADRRAAIRREIQAYQALKGHRVSGLFYKTDGLALQLGSRHFQANSRMLTRFNHNHLDYGPRYDAFNRDILRQEWATELPLWKRFTRKLSTIKARGVAASARDYQVDAWRRSTRFLQEWLSELRHTKPAEIHEDYYQSRAFGQSTRASSVIGLVYNLRKPVERGLTRDLKRLQRVQAVNAKTPSVGDVYRRGIVHAFLSPLRQSKRRTAIVTGQLWRLFRLAQVEDVPRDVYENARQTILLQGIDDPANSYSLLMDAAVVMREAYFSRPKDLRRVRRERQWTLRRLERPVPDILEPMRDRLVEIIRKFDLSTPPPDDTFAIFDQSRRFDREKEKIIPVLRRGAKTVDSPRKLRKATVAAIAATRPGAP
jgi:hypothetical protein